MDKLEREIKRTQAKLRRLEHYKNMRDPDFRALYDKFGDPVALGATHARLILRQREAQCAEGVTAAVTGRPPRH